MTKATLTASSDDGQLRLVLTGEIDISNSDQVENEIHAAIGNQATQVTVDLTNVTYIDSTGVRVLVWLTARLQEMQVELQLVAPAGSLPRRVIEITGLGDFAADSP